MKTAEHQADSSLKSNHLPLQTLFKNNSEKYEYLVENDPNNPWIAEFKNTKEYRLLYEENIC